MVPTLTTRESLKENRGSNLYLDASQNDYADTVAAVYSVRPFRAPNVSMPLEWKEIKDGLAPDQFNINNALKRIERKGEIFEKVHDQATAKRNDKQLLRFL